MGIRGREKRADDLLKPQTATALLWQGEGLMMDYREWTWLEADSSAVMS